MLGRILKYSLEHGETATLAQNLAGLYAFEKLHQSANIDLFTADFGIGRAMGTITGHVLEGLAAATPMRLKRNLDYAASYCGIRRKEELDLLVPPLEHVAAMTKDYTPGTPQEKKKAGMRIKRRITQLIQAIDVGGIISHPISASRHYAFVSYPENEPTFQQIVDEHYQRIERERRGDEGPANPED